jgi:hypothetical protein
MKRGIEEGAGRGKQQQENECGKLKAKWWMASD